MGKPSAKSENDQPGEFTPAPPHREPARLKIDMDWEDAAARVVKVPKPKKAAKKKGTRKRRS